jgi:hypothetical protein
MTNGHGHGTISNSDWLFSYNGDRMFGIVTFDLTQDDPTVTYNVVRASNNEILTAPYEVTVKGSQLNVPSLFNKADFNKDGSVDVKDIRIMSEEFLDSGIRPSN